MNGYELSRIWFDWCFVNPDKISPNHSALYFFCIEHCNRLGWKDKFGLPTTMAMEAIGIKSYNTYKKTLTELVDFGFIKMVQLSKNQYSANIVALSNFNKAVDKALDKALIKHSTKQVKSTRQSNDSIDKQLTTKPKTSNNKQGGGKLPTTLEDFKEIASKSFADNDCQFGNDFKKVWLEVLQESKWRKKSQSAINKSLKLLMKYDDVFAIALVEKSISGNYQGVVYDDTDSKYSKYLKEKNATQSRNHSDLRTERSELRNAALQIIRNG